MVWDGDDGGSDDVDDVYADSDADDDAVPSFPVLHLLVRVGDWQEIRQQLVAMKGCEGQGSTRSEKNTKRSKNEILVKRHGCRLTRISFLECFVFFQKTTWMSFD